ncbi:MAG: FlgO family outer membrane protein [Idiomarina sp.]
MKYLALVITAVVSVGLAGCTSQSKPMTVVAKPHSQAAGYSANEAMLSSTLAQELAKQLAQPLQNDAAELRLGITDLVDVTSQYDNATPLSQLFSENLIYALHQQQLQLVDYKTTNYIRVTPQGDFALSRDYMELDEISPVTHMLVGTMAEHNEGFIVNARVVHAQSNTVVSSGQVFIPAAVAQDLRASQGGLLRAGSE